MSDLINVFLNDKSATVAQSVGSVGATVIKAKRGGDEPVLFYPRSRNRILNYFGIPESGSEAIQDVIDYNDGYPVWVSAPSSGGRYGGVIVSTTGTKPFIGGKTNKQVDFSNFTNYEVAQTMDGQSNNVVFTVDQASDYVPGSLKILLNGVALELSVSEEEPEVITGGSGSGTYTRSTGILDFTFTDIPSKNDIVSVEYFVDIADSTYFVIFNKNAQADDLQVKITKDSSNDFVINMNKKSYSSGQYTSIQGFPKTGSIVENKKNGFQQNIYLPVLMQNEDLISVVVNNDITFSSFADDSSFVNFTGGVRGTVSSSDYVRGWAYFQNAQKYKADIMFDCSAEPSVIGAFDSLSKNYQKYAYYIFITPNDTVENSITAMAGLIPDNKSLACYWGWGKVKNQFNDMINSSSLMGRRALRLADMNDVYNGLAPAWYNENGKYGGQLGSGIIEMFYDANETQQQALENARINPTVMHTDFGVVNTRERTAQSLLSDYSSIGHVRLMQYIISSIVKQALPYQLYKLNDHNHRTSVSSQIDKIIAPTASEPYNLLREYEVKCDEENNDDDVLSREEFVVSVAIKFTPFSKKIYLYFTNTAQGTSVSESV